MKTEEKYEELMGDCLRVFLSKNNDYGSVWRNVRLSTLTDEIFIKVKRIKTIEELGRWEVNERIEDEYIGIINYAIMAQIQIKENGHIPLDLSSEEIEKLFSTYFKQTRDLMLKKNHDYGEAWRDMRLSSMTDLILTKVLRIKKMEEHIRANKEIGSEGPFSNYQDIINYAVFSIIKIQETVRG